jgi:hypothetical protein
MPRFREVSETYNWPAYLATFDPDLWASEADWHAARAKHASDNRWYAPGKFLVLNEVRAMCGVGPIADGRVGE